MKHNEQQIKEYRKQAIDALERVIDQYDCENFTDACRALARLQTYLEMPSSQYPVKQDI